MKLATIGYDPTSVIVADHPGLDEEIRSLIRARLSRDFGVLEVRNGTPGHFEVELPANADVKKVKSLFEERASIEFYDARNVSTGAGAIRTFGVGELTVYKGVPAYSFMSQATNERIGPGSKEYAQVIRGWGKPILTVADLESAWARQRQDGKYTPDLRFNSRGAAKMEAWSRRNNKIQEQLAAVIDGVVVSIAPLRYGTVLRNRASIEGNFDTHYVLALTERLNLACLPVHLTVTVNSGHE